MTTNGIAFFLACFIPGSNAWTWTTHHFSSDSPTLLLKSHWTLFLVMSLRGCSFWSWQLYSNLPVLSGHLSPWHVNSLLGHASLLCDNHLLMYRLLLILPLFLHFFAPMLILTHRVRYVFCSVTTMLHEPWCTNIWSTKSTPVCFDRYVKLRGYRWYRVTELCTTLCLKWSCLHCCSFMTLVWCLLCADHSAFFIPYAVLLAQGGNGKC